MVLLAEVQASALYGPPLVIIQRLGIHHRPHYLLGCMLLRRRLSPFLLALPAHLAGRPFQPAVLRRQRRPPRRDAPVAVACQVSLLLLLPQHHLHLAHLLFVDLFKGFNSLRNWSRNQIGLIMIKRLRMK